MESLSALMVVVIVAATCRGLVAVIGERSGRSVIVLNTRFTGAGQAREALACGEEILRSGRPRFETVGRRFDQRDRRARRNVLPASSTGVHFVSAGSAWTV
jgi:hypothetical protein